MKDIKNDVDHNVRDVDDERRKFLKQAGKVAATAPAVVLLINTSLKSTEAHAMYTYDPGYPDL
ncbi:MAG: hypothetical protein ABW082_11010 [Sedimenticola sp.]